MSAATPKYVARIARLPLVFEHLAAHQDGLSLGELAAEFDVPPEQLREDLLAFYTADVTPDLLMGLSRPGVLGFFGPDGDDADPEDAEVVRVLDARNADELGVEHVDASELALIYTAARALQEIDDDPDLAAAVDVLAETMFAVTDAGSDDPAPWNEALEAIQIGWRERRRVRIIYSRSWDAGVRERVIEPYRLVATGRGWEVDAGTGEQRGEVRTYIVGNIREAELLEETFEPPENLPQLLEAKRATSRVRVELPQSGRWAADMYAESVAVVDDQETTAVLDVDLLPPLKHRLGLLLLAAGSDAHVVEPVELRGAAADLARQLMAHHG
ncbi:WYL domain-containing protein [Nocardioides sp. HDW12B]|uniref:helix-turn-helix transcriptional regulator n=1 Tax=Nocardioides sp. HDW12B TaxID=2714939 RepID=UPI00140760D1|nr:WYL domain-containing protein [Nocardioides sp. HDW12B]QIK67285.1 WYL domain-containing protein [Nocardioides sp. HDW12B]